MPEVIYTNESDIFHLISESESCQNLKNDQTLDQRTRIEKAVNSVLVSLKWSRCEFSWTKPSTWFRFLSRSRTSRVMRAVKKFFSGAPKQEQLLGVCPGMSPFLLSGKWMPPHPRVIKLDVDPIHGKERSFRVLWDHPQYGKNRKSGS